MLLMYPEKEAGILRNSNREEKKMEIEEEKEAERARLVTVMK